METMDAPTDAPHLSAPGRPHWVCPKTAQLDLLYLSWGRRRYGLNRVPVSRHAGWQYVLVNKGEPTFVLEREEKVLNAGDFLVIHPECACGWTDQTESVSDLLVWLWRTGPRCSECGVAPRAYRHWTIGTRLCRRLEELYRLCRQEVEQPDELTNIALEDLHLAVDVAVARLVRLKTQAPHPATRMELALHWMAHNLAEPNPASALCEYLRISPSTLARMFQAQIQESPAMHHQRLRMRKAQELLRTERLSITEISRALGYKYPNDFNRGFKRFIGRSPSDLGKTGGNRSLKEAHRDGQPIRPL